MVPCIAAYISQTSARHGADGAASRSAATSQYEMCMMSGGNEKASHASRTSSCQFRGTWLSCSSVTMTRTTNHTSETSCSAPPTTASSRHRFGSGPGLSIGRSARHSCSHSSTSAPYAKAPQV